MVVSSLLIWSCQGEQAKDKRVVLFHFGASHIQAEIVTTRAKEYLHEEFGSAGPGFFFPFSALCLNSSVIKKINAPEIDE